jgi:prepilin-type N-terminal cleavage/methylation domain-containing protein
MARLIQSRVGTARLRRRSGFTLLEIVLALTIGAALMAALYVALHTQTQQTQQARDVVSESELAQTIIARISRETAACVPSTYSMTNFMGQWPGSGGGGGGGGGGGNGSGGGSGSGGGMSAGSGGGSGGGSSAGAASTSGSSSSSSTGTSTTGPALTSSVDTSQYQIPFATGLQGDNQHLILYVSQWPREVFDANLAGAAVPEMNDQRRITYWLASAGGLARQEVDLVTSDTEMGAVPPAVPDEASAVIAPEVKTLNFRFFDGTQWQDSWDGSQLGIDGVTPIGPPMAVEITLGIVAAGKPADEAHTKTYRRVVAILAGANPAVQPPQTTTITLNTAASATNSTGQ